VHHVLSRAVAAFSMTIEKTFAIESEPAVIWEALWKDLGKGEEGSFSVQESHWPARLSLRVELGGIPCLLTYRIERRDGHCEVSAALDPLSARYGIYQFLTFGHLRRTYETILVVGLANLKAAVEGAPERD
jgi:hypothetical protein